MLKIVQGHMSRLVVEPKASPRMSGLPELPDATKQPPTLSVAIPETVAACQRFFAPLVAVPDGGGGWTYRDKSDGRLPPADLTTIQGDRFVEETDGVYRLKAGERDIQLLNSTIRIAKRREDWLSGTDCHEMFKLAVACPASFGDEEKEIEIPKSEYRNACSLIRAKYPGVFVASADPDAQAEYLAKVYQRDYETAPREVHVLCSGWVPIGGKTSYWPGEGEFYAACMRPTIHANELMSVFLAGVAFLEVGHSNAAITVLWLKAHEAYSAFWLEKSGIKNRSAVYVSGPNGVLKTAVTSTLAAIHDADRSHATIRLTSTAASIRDRLVKMRDQVLVVDDFANSEPLSRKRALENMEDVIRANGDGVLPAKMSVKDFSRAEQKTVRCTIFLTGEEDPHLGQSTWNRLTTLHVDSDTFDGSVLTPFQEQPIILNRYFTAFEDFLTLHGGEIAEASRTHFDAYRAMYGQQFSVRRFVDAAAGLRVQADIVCAFAQYCGAPPEWAQEFLRLTEASIDEVFSDNQNSSAEKKPEIRFMEALLQSIGTAPVNGLAPDETTYVNNIAGFLGFKEESAGKIWLRFADTVALVKSYYRKLGQDWLTEEKTIKRLLLEKGISYGKLMPKGQKGTQYLQKSKKAPRTWMLVLRSEVVERMMNQEELI